MPHGFLVHHRDIIIKLSARHNKVSPSVVFIYKKKRMIEPTIDFTKSKMTSSVKKNNIYSILLSIERVICGRLYFSFFIFKSDTLVDRQSQDCNFLRQLFDIGNEIFSSELKKMSEILISFIEKKPYIVHCCLFGKSISFKEDQL